MRVLIVTGSYPPSKCGVGDYSFHLAGALADLPGIDVGVLTTRGAVGPAGIPGVKILPLMPGWRIQNVGHIRRAISIHRPDIVHIQYPGQGYDGVLARILPVVVKLCGARVVQTWHEHFSEGILLGLFNVMACNGLIYVRHDLPGKLPAWVDFTLGSSPRLFVPNATTIQPVELSAEEALSVRRSVTPDKAIVCYFGFPYSHKGVDRLFEIADPARHHLLLICDLDPADEYQAGIARLAKEPRWAGRVTVTGFLPSRRVAEFLAVADAAVFPFPGGAGDWNTSLKAAEASGLLTLATTRDPQLFGYHEGTNTFYAKCDDLAGLREALGTYQGRRVKPRLDNPWKSIAMAHDKLYRMVSGAN